MLTNMCSILLSIALSVPSLLPQQGTYKPLGSIKKTQGIRGYVDCNFDARNVYVCKP